MRATSNEPNGQDEDNTKVIGTFNPLRLAVLKLGLTELKYTSPLNYENRVGEYDCANCGTTLFDSNGKYDSGSGWPSFWKTSNEDRVDYSREWDGRTEVRCKNCACVSNIKLNCCNTARLHLISQVMCSLADMLLFFVLYITRAASWTCISRWTSKEGYLRSIA